MTTTVSWRGNPAPNTYTQISSGSFTDTTAAVVPAGYIDLDRGGANDVSLTMYGGQFSTGTQIYSEGIGGPTTLAFNGISAQAAWFYNFGKIDDRAGEMDMKVMGGEHFYNYATISVDSATMTNQALDVTITRNAIGYNGTDPTLFDNLDTINVTGNNPFGLTGALNVNATVGTEFLNSGTVNATSLHGSANFFGAGQIVNNGIIHASNGAQVSFQGSGVTGSGTVTADTGSRIQIGAPVGPGETFNLSGGSTLEFWVPPKMTFLSKIAGMDTSDTILIDQAFATHLSIASLSQAGAGLSEVRLFDQTNAVAADLQFVGHFNFGNFSLTPHASPTGNWTALVMNTNPH